MRLRGVRRGAFGVVGARPRARAELPTSTSLSGSAMAPPRLPTAAAQPGVALGAYCGNVSKTPTKDTRRARCNLPSGGSGRPRRRPPHRRDQRTLKRTRAPPAVRPMAPATRAPVDTRRHVVLGHATSLALQSAEVRTRIVSALAGDPGGVTVVCNPFTNMCLQDRRGTNAMAGAPIAADVATHAALAWAHRSTGAASCGRRRRRRLRQCARPLVRVRLRLRRPRRPPRCDGGRTARHGADGGRVGSARLLGSARALGCGGGVIAPGEPADVILFPSARHMNELLSRPQSDRVVLRGGQPQQTALPKYAELDDLVAKRSAAQWRGGGAARRHQGGWRWRPRCVEPCKVAVIV